MRKNFEQTSITEQAKLHTHASGKTFIYAHDDSQPISIFSIKDIGSSTITHKQILPLGSSLLPIQF
ncbi:hypothetical protein [Pseudanabaena sp. 'Roaring Creek']|uniref:hypothetical protein n=1 Tax=Pseudanabaena sp. 'Roaring Creek' TaxID=1681830 RepID=UPI000A83C6B0|nr:hypothetical protein [Pseudanabaena sp. 'Roaring Creek']